MKTSAAIVLAVMALAGSAKAYTISANVGPLLKQAQALIAGKNYKAALVKVKEAQAAQSNPDDEIVINQFRQVIAAASSDPKHPNCISARMGTTHCDGRAVGLHP